MKVWFISAYDAPRGHSSRTYDYARELHERGHQVTFITSSFDHFLRRERLTAAENFRIEEIDGIRVIWLKTVPYGSGAAMRFVNMLSQAWRAHSVGVSDRETPDVIVGPSVPLFTALAAYRIARRKGCAFTFEVRDIWPQALVDLGILSPRNPVTIMLRWLERYLYRRAHRIVTVLPLAYRHIVKDGVAKDKIAYIPNGVNYRRFTACRPYDGGSAGRLRVTYIGGFSTTHSVETILLAAREISRRGIAGVDFTIVGGGRAEEELKKLAASLNVENCRFLGIVDKDKVPGLLEESDVLVASVKDTPVYQFGINSNKIFDYLASGRPVIFAGNAPHDPVQEAQAGITVPPEEPARLADAVLAMLAMPKEERLRLGENGSRYAREHYDTRILAVTYENVLFSAVAERRSEHDT